MPARPDFHHIAMCRRDDGGRRDDAWSLVRPGASVQDTLKRLLLVGGCAHEVSCFQILPDIAAAPQTTAPIRIADAGPIGLSAPRSARSRRADVTIVAEVGRAARDFSPILARDPGAGPRCARPAAATPTAKGPPRPEGESRPRSRPSAAATFTELLEPLSVPRTAPGVVRPDR